MQTKQLEGESAQTHCYKHLDLDMSKLECVLWWGKSLCFDFFLNAKEWKKREQFTTMCKPQLWSKSILMYYCCYLHHSHSMKKHLFSPMLINGECRWTNIVANLRVDNRHTVTWGLSTSMFPQKLPDWRIRDDVGDLWSFPQTRNGPRRPQQCLVNDCSALISSFPHSHI